MMDNIEIIIRRECEKCSGSGLRIGKDGFAVHPLRPCEKCKGGQVEDYLTLRELRLLLEENELLEIEETGGENDT